MLKGEEEKTKKGLKVVACHLGTGGSSAAGIVGGKSVSTTMGWSPLAGLVMSTRTGDLDPAIALSLVGSDDGKGGKRTAEQVLKMFNSQSGLVGLTNGVTSDLRDVWKIAHNDQEPDGEEKKQLCKLAWGVYVERLLGALGQMIAACDGLDVLLFTDDHGFDMWQLREAVCSRLGKWLGIELDVELNKVTSKGKGALAKSNIAVLSTKNSKVMVVAIVNDEEKVIAQESSQFF